MKHLNLAVMAAPFLFISIACNEAKFQSDPVPSVAAPKDPALDVSEISDKNDPRVRDYQDETPVVQWPTGANVPGQNPNQTPNNGRGPLLPLPGSKNQGEPTGEVPSTPVVGIPNAGPNGSNPGSQVPGQSQTPGQSQIPGMPNPNGNDPGFNGFPDDPTKTGPIPPAQVKTPVPGILVPEGRRIELAAPNCTKSSGANLPVIIDVDAARNQRVEASISGEFCPQSNRLVNILFVVDFSASMGRHQPETGGPVQDGNDPLVNGACGRLAATQAIISKMKSLAKPGDTIRVGMIPFAGDVVRSFVIPGTSLASFEQAMTPERFCRYVLQGEQYRTPGAMTRGEASGADSSTNYRAAFAAATGAMNRAQGRNMIYFITDGEPTTPKPNPVEVATAAANQLRREIPNLTFNGIILGSQRPAAEQVLNVVTGSPERVRYAAQAADLANEITQFADARIDVNHPGNTGWVFVDPYPVQKLGLANLVEASPQLYTYKTQPLVLLGIPGQTILNRVVVEARGFDGSTHRSVVIIRYRQL